jgi:hypothetical protein
MSAAFDFRHCFLISYLLRIELKKADKSVCSTPSRYTL